MAQLSHAIFFREIHIDMPATITLTSDLGEQEPFVASIKGVLLSGCPEVKLVDLGHQISPHQVTEAALFVLGAIPYFPKETVHLVTVAPGPAPIAVKIQGQTIVCPDNGVLTLLEDHFEIEGIREIEVPESVSACDRQTFFGREVFAPAAAALAGGTPFDELGQPRDTLHRIEWPQPIHENPRKVEGRIMHVDRFGNLITNIHCSHLEGATVDRVAAGNCTVYEISCAYDDVPAGKPVALFGHAGYLELAYNGDRANERLQLTPGIFVNVFVKGDS